MKTVQDYRDLGLVFVKGDFTIESDGSSNSGDSCFDVNRYFNQDSAFNTSKVESFAWRNNDGVKPEYKGLIDVCFEGGTVSHNESSIDFEWSLNDENYIAKWRPVVLQSDDAKDNKDESFMLPIGIDSPELREAFKLFNDYMETNPKFTIKEEAPSRTTTVNIEGRDYILVSHKPAASPKEDNPMKPVYTAEMHAKGELPPVGAECILTVYGEPRPAKVTYIGKDIVCCSNVDGDAEYACLLGSVSFKPIIKTIKVNSFDVPAPMSEAPSVGDEYFTPQTGYDVFYGKNLWRDDRFDSRFLSRGLIHLTKESAIAHAKAMLGINPNPSRGGDGYDRNILGQNNEGDEL